MKPKQKKAPLVASGRIEQQHGKFLPVIHLDAPEGEIEGILEEEAFDTHQECAVFLGQQLHHLVETLCEKLGYAFVRCNFSRTDLENPH